MDSVKELAIIICTYNRSKLLGFCLDSIVRYCNDFKEKITVIIVDNNSSDQTKEIVESYVSNYNPKIDFQYYFEKNQGLSYARNTGAKMANSKWLFYLDDDGMIVEDTLSQLFKTIDDRDFDIFGGCYDAYYIEEKPKWLSNDFGVKKSKYKEKSYIGDEQIHGGIMVIRKSALQKLNYFNSEFGMKGNQLIYGEEDELINKAKKAKLKIGINPNFKMKHLVQPYKYSLLWQLKNQYFLGRDMARNYNEGQQNFAKSLFIVFPINVLNNIFRLLADKNYYFQNFFYDSFKGVFIILGIIKGRKLRM